MREMLENASLGYTRNGWYFSYPFQVSKELLSEIREIPNRKQRKGNVLPWHFPPRDGDKGAGIMHDWNSRMWYFRIE